MLCFRMKGVEIGPCRQWQSHMINLKAVSLLPFPWWGLTDGELSEVAGIPGCTFVHMSGFIGANQSYKGALDMAKHSLMA